MRVLVSIELGKYRVTVRKRGGPCKRAWILGRNLEELVALVVFSLMREDITHGEPVIYHVRKGAERLDARRLRELMSAGHVFQLEFRGRNAA
jgi:hypothetical protein